MGSLGAALSFLTIHTSETADRILRGNSGVSAPPGTFPDPPAQAPGAPDPPLEAVPGWTRKGGHPGKGKVKDGKLGTTAGAQTAYVLEPIASPDREAEAELLNVAAQQGYVAPLVINSKNWVGTTYVPASTGPGAHRWWRVRQVDGHVAGDFAGCSNLELHSAIGGPDITTPTMTITASAQLGGYEATKAINDNLTDFWTTGTAAPPTGGHWLKVDLGVGNAQEVVELAYKVRTDSFREDPAHLVLEWSDDDATWTTALEATSIPAWTTGESRAFSGVESSPARLKAVKKVNGVETELATVDMTVGAGEKIGGRVDAGNYFITHEGAVVGGPYAIAA